VTFAETLWACPQCQKRMEVHDYEERRWRHLDSCQFKTVLVSRVPIVRCPEHGSETVAVPWAEKHDRFSRLLCVRLTALHPAEAARPGQQVIAQRTPPT
jgi:transposase